MNNENNINFEALVGEHVLSGVDMSEEDMPLLPIIRGELSARTALGPDAGAWHREQADWLERELRDFIAAMGDELRLVVTDDPERKTFIVRLYWKYIPS